MRTETHMARMGRVPFEIVHTGPHQFHSRLRAANGEIVWTTETYTRRRGARLALLHLGKFAATGSTPWQMALQIQSDGFVEVRQVDERAS